VKILIVEFLLSRKVFPEDGFFSMQELLIISFFLLGSLYVDFHFNFVFAYVPVVVLEIEVDLGFKSLLEAFKGML
jgi:hypothetical protein